MFGEWLAVPCEFGYMIHYEKRGHPLSRMPHVNLLFTISTKLLVNRNSLFFLWYFFKVAKMQEANDFFVIANSQYFFYLRIINVWIRSPDDSELSFPSYKPEVLNHGSSRSVVFIPLLLLFWFIHNDN